MHYFNTNSSRRLTSAVGNVKTKRDGLHHSIPSSTGRVHRSATVPIIELSK